MANPPEIPKCDRPGYFAVTYQPNDDRDRRLVYCGPHVDLFTKALKQRRLPFTQERVDPPEACHAWKDL